jgi:hypothetical protein
VAVQMLLTLARPRMPFLFCSARSLLLFLRIGYCTYINEMAHIAALLLTGTPWLWLTMWMVVMTLILLLPP